jgi:hypothetical protein
MLAATTVPSTSTAAGAITPTARPAVAGRLAPVTAGIIDRLGTPAGKVLLALIGEAQHDAEMARTFHQRYLDPQRRQEREMLNRGITAGQLSEALDVDAALDALCGPIVYRALTGAPIPRSFSNGLVTDILDQHLA